MMFDITDKESFCDLSKWIELITTSVYPSVYPSVFPTDKQLVLIGNKSDQENSRQVQTCQASSYAKEIGAKFIEISAKTGENVIDCLGMLDYSKT